MNPLPWIGMIALGDFNLSARAEVTLDRSVDAVALENSLVRIDLRQDRNFQPLVLIDNRNPQQSLIDDIGFSAWKLSQAD